MICPGAQTLSPPGLNERMPPSVRRGHRHHGDGVFATGVSESKKPECAGIKEAKEWFKAHPKTLLPMDKFAALQAKCETADDLSMLEALRLEHHSTKNMPSQRAVRRAPVRNLCAVPIRSQPRPV